MDAVLHLKHHRGTPTQDLLDALRTVGPVSVDLVVVSREWVDGHPRLTFEVEDYEPLENVPQRLFRYADTSDGPWWSGSRFDAWRKGSGRHDTPTMWVADAEQLDVLAAIRCRFGWTYAPYEFVASNAGMPASISRAFWGTPQPLSTRSVTRSETATFRPRNARGISTACGMSRRNDEDPAWNCFLTGSFYDVRPKGLEPLTF